MKFHFGLSLMVLFFVHFQIKAQNNVRITVISAEKKLPVQGCLVDFNGREQKVTDSTGVVQFTLTEPKTIELSAALLGFFPKTGKFLFSPGDQFILELKEKNILSSEVVIQGILPIKDQPTTFSVVSGEELSKTNLGQDLPYLLQNATSVVSTSDAGTGIGYTGLSVRGSDATRVNVTINGIPLNDSESHGVFWVNTPDLASSVDEIQIQRGVGSSTNGSAAFGASLNLQTTELKSEPYGKVNVGAGSFNTQRLNLSSGTGLINGHYSLDVRLSKITSDGFIDRAKSDLEGMFITGGYYSENRTTRLNYISGKEQTYQAWNGIPESKLNQNPKEMTDYVLRNGLNSNDSLHLFNSGSRTYNSFTYPNQNDNYQQNHYQLFHSEKAGKKGLINVALHLTTGKGYYEEYKVLENLSNYGISAFISGNDTIGNSDLIRQRWLDNIFGGSVYSYTLNTGIENKLITGGGFNYYEGDHFGKVIWTQYSGEQIINHEYYRNTAIKRDINHYIKYSGKLRENLLIFADLQGRLIDYRFVGFNADLQPSEQRVNFLFFNPKIGLTYFLRPNSNLYFSYGKSGREPVRDDFVNSSPESRPKPEILHNTEMGWRYNGSKTRIAINHYFMYYQNQLVLTGKINDVGAYTRTNVPQSYRSGLEAEINIGLSKTVSLSFNSTYSINRVMNYEFFNFNYDTGQEDLRVYASSPIAFSPDLIVNSQLILQPIKNLEIGIIGKHVGRQFLDNTGDYSKSVRDYTVFNLRAGYKLDKVAKGIGVNLLVNNLLNRQYETHGYTYGYQFGGQQINENFFFPQSGINFLAGFQFSF